MTESIDNAYQAFKAQVYSEISSNLENEERRAAYFAGACWVFSQLNALAIDDDRAHELLTSLRADLDEFRQELNTETNEEPEGLLHSLFFG